MDFSGYQDFPFPSGLTGPDAELRDYFLALSDEQQMRLLNASRSYPEFHDRVEQYRSVMQIMQQN